MSASLTNNTSSEHQISTISGGAEVEIRDSDSGRGTNQATVNRTIVSRVWILSTVLFVVGFVASVAFTNWSGLKQLYLESALARYEAMTGDSEAPTTYYVFHSNSNAVQSLGNTRNDILSVETTDTKYLSRVTFAKAKVEGISVVRNHPDVRLIMNTEVPLICH